MKIYFTILFIITISRSIDGISNVKQFVQSKNITFSRRILGGEEAGDTRPYMVYLRPANSDTSQNWLCGGVIIHEHYILTSAACIEEVKQFYVVSGTHRWIPPTEKNDPCIVNGAKKAVWKCVPKNYFFDGDEFDNSRWMVKDIAVVKVEDDFNFKRRIKGCDFIPQKIAFNNVSDSQEKPGIVGSVAGWGSTDRFSDVNSAIARVAANSPMLLEADIVIMGKKACKNKWEPQYHYIIDEEMICAKDNFDSDAMSALCADQVECKDIMEIDDEDTETGRRFVDGNLKVHTASHINEARKSNVVSGGFCENDHGGPLIVGHGKSAMVVGIISACLTKQLSHKCHGPFLYTSIWKNRHLINCAIDKDISATCRRLLRSAKTDVVETTFNWMNHTES